MWQNAPDKDLLAVQPLDQEVTGKGPRGNVQRHDSRLNLFLKMPYHHL